MSLLRVSKRILATTLGSAPSYHLLKRILYSRLFPYVQAVTYHGTPESLKDSFCEHLQWYRRHFCNCDLRALQLLLDKGVWPHDQPGLIVTFDDGLRSNYDTALALLEESGFTGWFMVSPGFVSTETRQQREFARQHRIDIDGESAADRIAMTWEEIRDLWGRGHVVACHTMNHKRLSSQLSTRELEVEIVESKAVMEAHLGRPVDIFTWVGGEEWAYSREAHEMITRSGYTLTFCTNCAPITGGQSPMFLQRYHVDADYDVGQLRFVLGGFYDAKYFWKRKRVSHALLPG